MAAVSLLAHSAAISGAVANATPALPVGGTVAAGSATVGAANGGNVTITQTSAKAVINPNGIAITKSGVVNVGRGFVASLADIADSYNG